MFRVILLCLLTCCSSFMPLKLSESIISKDHTQVVEKKTKENFVQTSSGYYEFGTTDLFAYDFLEGLINYYVNDLGVSDLSPNSDNSVSNYVLQTSGVYEAWVFNRFSKSYDRVFYVSNLVINKTPLPISSSDSFPVLVYNYIFSNSSPYDKQITLNFFAQRTDSMRLTIWGVTLNASQALLTGTFGGQQYTSNEVWSTRFMLSEKRDAGYNAFIGNIWNSIHSDPYNQGYNTGYDFGLNNGKEIGYRQGYTAGYDDGEVAGYTTGYNTGVSDTISSGSEAMTIFAGIMDVAFIPVNVFFLMFDYEVFGINIAGFVSGLLTIAIVIILMRFIFGRKV